MPCELIPFLMSKPFEKERAIRLFWRNVRKESGDGCWIWTRRRGLQEDSKYGLFQFGTLCGRTLSMLAHRFSLAIVDGVDRDLFVCHRCDNPPCVRPDHLWWGTHQQNMHDKISKGRGLRQDRFLQLTDEIVAGASLKYDEVSSPGRHKEALKAAVEYGVNQVVKGGSLEKALRDEIQRLKSEIRKWKARVLQAELQKSSDPIPRDVS